MMMNEGTSVTEQTITLHHSNEICCCGHSLECHGVLETGCSHCECKKFHINSNHWREDKPYWWSRA